jgi:hypothetical protein
MANISIIILDGANIVNKKIEKRSELKEKKVWNEKKYN